MPHSRLVHLNNMPLPDKTQIRPPLDSSPTMLGPGSVLAGKYEIEREIARGGMGVVYLAHQAGLARQVAIKVVAPSLASSPDFARRFRREAIALAQLRHSNIVSVHDFAEEPSLVYLVMDFVAGGNLEEYVARFGQPQGLPLEEVVHFAEQLLSGLAHAHRAGIIHRDIKPANLLLEDDRELRISDFGLAQIRTDLTSQSVVVSPVMREQENTQSVSGTIDFMAPEVRRGLPADQRADIYAAGIIIYWLCCGERPGPLSLPLSRRAAQKGLHSGWDRFMARALAESVEARFQSAGEMLAALRELKGSKTPNVRREDLPTATVLGRNPLLKKLTLAGVVLGIVLLIVMVILMAKKL